MIVEMHAGRKHEITGPAKLAETASTDMLRLVREALADMAMSPAAATLPWSIL